MLKWEMVSFARNLIVMPAKLHKTGKKTGKDRTVPVLPLVKRLLLWIRKRSANALVCPHPEAGREWDDNSFSQHFRRLRERAGIGYKHGEQLVLYSNR